MNAKTWAAIYLVLLAFVVAFIARKRQSTSAPNACINILRQLDGAKQQWALEKHKTAGDIATWEDIFPYCHYRSGDCPQGGTYTLGRVQDLPTCSLGSQTNGHIRDRYGHSLPPRTE